MNSATKDIPTKDIIIKTDIYPRIKPNPQKIQEYAECIESLPPIEINQDNILIDGYHRLKAYETAGEANIPTTITETINESELEHLSVQRNAIHGLQLTRQERINYANKWWGNLPDEYIRKSLSISQRTLTGWTANKQRGLDTQRDELIFDKWMSCHTQEQIGVIVGLDQSTVNDRIAEIMGNGKFAESHNFRNFEPQLYSIWNFGKANNNVKHPGYIPPEIIDNLLYYFTKPFDVVFDPFAGGGSTIDICLERHRRYYVSDLTPIPARSDIREWDITNGLPPDLPVPDFVFLDPPYWKQARGKYSNKQTDLSNAELNDFVVKIGNIAQAIKRKWSGNRPQGKLALIIGLLQEDWQYTDLPFLCFEAITKYLDPVIRIQVPYSTQVHSGAYVNKAKEHKHILYLSRDLMVFRP